MRRLVAFGEDGPPGMLLVKETLADLGSADVEFALLERCSHSWHECPVQFCLRLRAFLGMLSVKKLKLSH